MATYTLISPVRQPPEFYMRNKEEGLSVLINMYQENRFPWIVVFVVLVGVATFFI